MNIQLAEADDINQLKMIFYKMGSMGIFEQGRFVLAGVKGSIENGEIFVVKDGNIITAFVEFHKRRDGAMVIRHIWTAVPRRGEGRAIRLIAAAYRATGAESIEASCAEGAKNNTFYERYKLEDYVETKSSKARLRKYILDAGKIQREAAKYEAAERENV